MSEKLGRPWFLKSIKDLKLAQLVFEADKAFLDEVAFHCQQSVEKAIKGFLSVKRQRIPKTHDVGELGYMVSQFENDLEGLLKSAARFTDFAVYYRYPSEKSRDLTEKEVEEILKMTNQIYDELFDRSRDA